MERNLRLAFISMSLLISFISQTASESKTPAETPLSEAVKLGENLYRIGRVTVDTERREVSIRGWVNMNAGLIEYLACSAGGKLHESLLVLDTKPIHLQVALILIGMEAKGDFEFQGNPSPPEGDPVEIWVQWMEGEETRRVRAEQMVLDVSKKEPMQKTQWVFTGSVIYQGRFIAEIEKSLIATYHDPAAIINNPLPEGADDTVYNVNSKLVPERGKAIVLTIKAAGEKKNSSQLPSGIDSFVSESQSEKVKILFQESFDQGKLDPSRWVMIRDGDFNQFAVDVQDARSEQGNDYRLRIMADTLETSDPVKYLGVRSRERVDLSQPTEISFDLDWNDQQNGCYLTAGLYICPVESENPKKEKDWIKFEWTGVPPGRNIRTDVWANVNGALKQLYTDWGPRNENGRQQGWSLKPGSHRIKLLVNGKGIRVWADSKQLCYVEHSLGFTSGYLYLQMSSGTNYPAREIYFDNVAVTAIGIR